MRNCLIVILNWNNSQLTINLVEQIHVFEKGLDVCIIDNHSEKPEINLLVNYVKGKQDSIILEETLLKTEVSKITRHKLYLIKNRANFGYAKGNNIGIILAHQKKYAFTIIANNDILIKENISDYLIRNLQLDENVILIGPKVVDQNNKIQGPYRKERLVNTFLYPLLFPWIALMNEFLKGSMQRIISTQIENPIDEKPYRLMGCYLVMKTELVFKIGMFDENTFLYYEEAILSEKIERMGYSISYCPDVSVLHFGGLSTTSVYSELYRYKIQSGTHYYKYYRNYGPIRIILFKTGTVILNHFWAKIIKLTKTLNRV